jgi:hypothetical protein
MERDSVSPLIRLKILIWVHSAIGGFLLVGLPALALATDRKELAVGSLPGIFIWCFGYGALRNKAVELAPEDRVPPKGLPLWVPLLVAIGAFLSPVWLASPLRAWVAAAWIFLAVTIAIRWGISRSLDLPVHRKTWGGLLVALSIPLVFALFILVMVMAYLGC